MYQRIKQLRESIPLSQAAFGKKMGVSRDVINNIEQDRNKKPVSELFISHLCETFNVNEAWLRTGIGDMFIPVDTSSLSALKKEYNLSQKATAILENFLKLSDKEQDEFIDLAEKIFNDSKEDTETGDEFETKLFYSNTDDSQLLAAESSLLDGDSKIFDED